jgi:hypothetical protein
MLTIIEKFISTGHIRSSIKIFVDEMIFAVKINRTGVVRFVFGGDDVSKGEFLEQLDTYIYSAKNVHYKVVKLQKFTNPSINSLVSDIATTLDSLEVDEQIVTEVCKIQTFTTMEIDRVAYPNFQGFLAYNSIINIIDTYEDHGVVNNDLLINVLETRPAIFEDMIKTVSKKRIVSEIRRILRTTEPTTPCSAQVIRTLGRCVLNLTTPHMTFANFKLTPGAIEDRYKYNRIKDYSFVDEVLEAAWAPWRYQDWCLDQEDKTRITGYSVGNNFGGV